MKKVALVLLSAATLFVGSAYAITDPAGPPPAISDSNGSYCKNNPSVCENAEKWCTAHPHKCPLSREDFCSKNSVICRIGMQ